VESYRASVTASPAIEFEFHSYFALLPFREGLLATNRLSASWISITLWVVSAILAGGIGWSRYEKKKNRDKLLQDLAALTPDRREQLLGRLRPELQMEVRQQLMRRYGLS
jgi:hypothetical protein